ncbi:hypothetical protein IF1G_06289 [Cordyceps javanica]|uniref:Uncharacterized protein n=1 Tax=Cordyceps javanica TaxID=43265 RepID=A0A545V0S0_9HYPO|nr:hypothetical protein IF1G_06289 [Cordyceps javanica]
MLPWLNRNAKQQSQDTPRSSCERRVVPVAAVGVVDESISSKRRLDALIEVPSLGEVAGCPLCAAVW